MGKPSGKTNVKSRQAGRHTAGRRGVSTAQILLVVGAAVIAAALLIVLNSSLVRTTGLKQVDYPTGITAEGRPYKGAADAPLQMHLYSDFLCGHCSDFAATLDALDEDYLKTGRLQVVFYNYAFLTPESTQSAIAALCAADQNPAEFWRYYDILYGSRAGGMAAYSDSRLKAYARELGLDTARFDQCFQTKAKAVQVQTDVADGRARGVDGTPTWFLNGRMEVGAMSEAALRQLLDEAYEQAQTGN
jgi:protein-disulfide isomerase